MGLYYIPFQGFGRVDILNAPKYLPPIVFQGITSEGQIAFPIVVQVRGVMGQGVVFDREAE
jgi:hypothetical protein